MFYPATLRTRKTNVAPLIDVVLVNQQLLQLLMQNNVEQDWKTRIMLNTGIRKQEILNCLKVSI
jgi:hypothetical protein